MTKNNEKSKQESMKKERLQPAWHKPDRTTGKAARVLVLSRHTGVGKTFNATEYWGKYSINLVIWVLNTTF